MKYTAITKKDMTTNGREMPAGTRLEVVGLHDNTVSCIWDGSHCGMFTVLRTEVDIEEHPDGKLLEIDFNVSGHMRVTVEVFEPAEGDDVMWSADAEAIRDGLEAGAIAISPTTDGEAILTADGTVIGRTHCTKDQTDWDDFAVQEVDRGDFAVEEAVDSSEEAGCLATAIGLLREAADACSSADPEARGAITSLADRLEEAS
jgi:hypothetical protein